MHKRELLIPPNEEPIILEEVKRHLNLSSSTMDSYLTTLIVAARKNLERYLKRALVTQTWAVYYDRFCDKMLIPFGNLQIVDGENYLPKVEYFDLDGNIQTLDPDLYWVSKTQDPAYILRGYDSTYPEVQYGRPDSIRITFQCGYGDADQVPEQIKHAMKIIITNLFEHRGEIVITNFATKIPGYITDLVHDYRLYSF